MKSRLKKHPTTASPQFHSTKPHKICSGFTQLIPVRLQSPPQLLRFLDGEQQPVPAPKKNRKLSRLTTRNLTRTNKIDPKRTYSRVVGGWMTEGWRGWWAVSQQHLVPGVAHVRIRLFRLHRAVGSAPDTQATCAPSHRTPVYVLPAQRRIKTKSKKC